MPVPLSTAAYRAEHLGALHKAADFYWTLPFRDAVEYGASAAGPHGNIHRSQRRVGVRRLRRSAMLLLKRLEDLRRARSFADLFFVTESVRPEIRGLGDCWSYDTALRIAFHLGSAFYPQAVFLMRANRGGIRKLFSQKPMKGRTPPVDISPLELRVFKAYELEDFLRVWGKGNN